MKPLKIYNNFSLIPFANFIQVSKTNDLRYLYNIDFSEIENIKVDESETKRLKAIWDGIYNDYYAQYGFTDELDKILTKERQCKLAMLTSIKEAITQNDPSEKERILRMHSNKIKVLEFEIKGMIDKMNSNKSKKELDIDELSVVIEDFKKREIDPYKVSAKKFFFMKKQLEDYIEDSLIKKSRYANQR